MKHAFLNILLTVSVFILSACAQPPRPASKTESLGQNLPTPLASLSADGSEPDLAAPDQNHGQGEVIQAGNLSGLRPLRRLGEGTFGYEMALSADGTRLALTSSAGILLVDALSGERIRQIDMPAGAESTAFSPDGKTLAAVYRLPNKAPGAEASAAAEADAMTPLGQMTTLGVWNTDDGSARFIKDLSGTDCGERLAHGLGFSRDGLEIYLIESTSWRGLGDWHNLCVYAAADGGLLRARDLHPQETGVKIADAVLSDDRQRSAVALKGAIAIHDAQGAETTRLATEVNPDVMAFSPDGQTLAFAGYEEGDLKTRWRVFLWNLNDSAVSSVLTGFNWMAVSIAWSPDGSRIAAGLSDGLIVWKANEEILFQNQPIALRVPPGEAAPGTPWDLVFSADGNTLYGLLNTSTLGIPGEVRAWRMPGGEELWRIYDHIESPAAFSADGSRMALGGFADGRVQIWDAAGAGLQAEWNSGQGLINQVLFSADGAALVTAGQDGSLGVWNAATGARQAGWNGNASPITHIDLSPSGERLASASADGKVVVREFPSGETVQMLQPAPEGWIPTVLAFTVDGKGLLMGWNLYNQISGYRGQWILWDAGTNTLRPLANTWPEAALRDGQGSLSLVWSAENGLRLGRLDGEQITEIMALVSPKGNGALEGFAISPAGNLLVSGNAFGLHVWNLPTPQPSLIDTGAGGAYPIGRMSFSADGRRLAISSSPLTLWGIAP